MTKITFIEPYASQGGHMSSNVHQLPERLVELKAGIEFIVEKGIEVPAPGCTLQWLTPSNRLKNMKTNKALEIREKEYREIIRKKTGVLVFLSNFNLDIHAWQILLSDPLVIKEIKTGERLVIIHISRLFFPFYELNHRLNREIKSLRNHLFFSFFSELQTAWVRQDTGLSNLVTRFQSAYEGFSRGPAERDGTYLSYLGFFQEDKGIHRVLEIFQKPRVHPFFVHFYPLRNANLIRFNAFKRYRRPGDTVLGRMMKPQEYKDTIFSSRAGLLPYDSYSYALRASGLLEEYMFAGVPVIVPHAAWLSFFLEKYEGGGTVFREEIEGDFEEKFKHLLHHYDDFKGRARLAASRLLQERNTARYLEIIHRLNETRMANDDLSVGLESRYSTILRKGTAYLYTHYAETLMEKGDTGQASLFLKKALEADDGYWKARRLYNDTPGSGKNVGVHPFSGIRRSDFVGESGEWYFDGPEASGNPSLFAGFCFNIGDFLARENPLNKEWKDFYRKGIELLIKKRWKTRFEIYRIASSFKRLGDFGQAVLWFEKILNRYKDKNVVSGACFHSGEIYYKQNKFKDAARYFEKCLALDPQHQKAKEMQKMLNHGK